MHTTKPRRGRKPKAAPESGRTIGRRLRELRDAAGVSQAAIGAQGFVSMPGWIKIEGGLRLPSEKLLTALVAWLVEEGIIRPDRRLALLEELVALKYAAHRCAFLSKLAKAHLAELPPVTLG